MFADSNPRRSWPWSLLAISLTLGCAEGTNELDAAREPSSGADAGGTGGLAGAGGAVARGGSPAGGGVAGTAGSGGDGGSGLSSDVFGSGGTSGTGTTTEACDDSSEPACDWSRIDGCCKAFACERAAGSDVFNTYPVESCQALIACVQANEGCSTASDPLCFQDEDPDAPCLMEGYQASHTDPDGPFAWTAALVSCVCGY